MPPPIARSPDAGPLLELRKVSAGYEGTEDVLREVTLTVDPGEVAAAVSLDMSGGKSTLLKVAAGLLEPHAGQVLFRGRDVYAMDFASEQRFRRETAVVLEGGALLVNQSVWENVALPLRYHGGRTAREIKTTVERLLEQCGFNEDPHALPWQVSTRGLRLAAFARALARDPALVLVDQFFHGLEAPDWRRLFEVVMELNQHQGVSWLLISDVDPSIFKVAERVAVLEGGRLIGHDFRSKLYQSPRIRGAFMAAELKSRVRRQTERFLGDDSTRWEDLRRELLAEEEADAAAAGARAMLEAHSETIDIDGRMPGPDVSTPVRRLAREDAPTVRHDRSAGEFLGGGGGLETTIQLPPEELAHNRPREEPPEDEPSAETEPATEGEPPAAAEPDARTDPDAPTPDPDAPA